ncbi:hypothetical protein ACE1AT_25210 [Pelatocladus sp. BLCC-F211]|uniref:hypothetical protein n=1 Tax=Pelatocladus sp. BLCC-F211 TaxID=3342752 RepID=UPI0035B7719C
MKIVEVFSVIALGSNQMRSHQSTRFHRNESMKIITQIYKHQYFPVLLTLLCAALFLYGVIVQASEKCSPGGGRRHECIQMISD